MPLSYDDLFAIRFSMQETFIDEHDIISRLKLKLYQEGMCEKEIDIFLIGFSGVRRGLN